MSPSSDPTVSIALASYNGARFIEAQLRSFADQTRPPDQVVIRDDGSTDDTAAIVARFAETAPFTIDFQRNPERCGYTRNFEGAVAACSGDIIFLSDQDDVWLPNKLQTILDAFVQHPRHQVIVNDQILTDGDLNHTGITKLGNLKRLGIGPEGLIEGCCTAFRRAWGERLLPIPAEAGTMVESRAMSHDRWLNELAMLLDLREVVRTPLQYFRRYGSNTTNWLVSEPRQSGMRDLVAARVPVAPVAAWRERIATLDLYESWLRDHQEAVASFHGDLTKAFAKLDRERTAHRARCALAVQPLPRRAWAAVTLWRRGGYAYFNGWISALRDVTRSAP
jgi:glycosyltransferase involved in cell wall biosynthesis